jgi:hypothetical protein
VLKKLLRVALLVIAVALPSSALLLFNLEATSDGGAPALDRSIGVSDALTQPANCDTGPQTIPHLVITVSNFDPRALTITLNAVLCFPPEAFSRLRNTFVGEGEYNIVPVARGDPRYHIWVPRRFLGLTINVRYAPIIPAGREGQEAEEAIERHTTVYRLLGGSKQGEWRSAPVGRFVVPLASAPRRYPFDWYALRGKLSVGDPTFRLAMCCSDESGTLFPFYLTVLRGQNISPFVVRASTKPTPRQQHEEGNQIVSIQLQRSDITRAYVVVVACLTLLLGLLLCVLLFGTGRPVGPDGLTGVAAVLLAILPIRLVLVPSEVSELTLIDFWFAFEMALLAAVACVAVWRALGESNQETRHRSQRS